MKFNVNEEVRIKLTDLGRAKLRANHDKIFNTPELRRDYPYLAPKEDAAGWSNFQLWNVMVEFGDAIGNGAPLLFDTNIDIPLPKRRSADRREARKWCKGA